MKLFLSFLLVFSQPAILSAQQLLDRLDPEKITPSIFYYSLQTDTLFNSVQDIHILVIDKRDSTLGFDLEYRDTMLVKTSDFAIQRHAIAGINGGFFDVKHGGSVNYMEAKGKAIDLTRKQGEEGAISGKTMNGAVVLDTTGNLKVEKRESDEVYMNSRSEDFVLVTGPLLLLGGNKLELPDTNFSNNRHPRSCLCLKKESIILIAVDGRSESGSGMSLPELQKFLGWIDCDEAINLDGGGSTTLWANNGGAGKVLNHPSDKTGERRVANVILLINRLNPIR